MTWLKKVILHVFLKYYTRLVSFQSLQKRRLSILRAPIMSLNVKNHYKKKIEEKFRCIPGNSYMAISTVLLKCLEVS